MKLTDNKILHMASLKVSQLICKTISGIYGVYRVKEDKQFSFLGMNPNVYKNMTLSLLYVTFGQWRNVNVQDLHLLSNYSDKILVI